MANLPVVRGQRGRAVGAVAMLVLLAACASGPSAARRGAAGSSTTVAYGAGLDDVAGPSGGDGGAAASQGGSVSASADRGPVDGAAAAPGPAPTDPTTGIDLTVVDPDGHPRHDVVVRLLSQDGAEGAATSDGHGRIRVALPPGRYRVSAAAGCTGQLRVLRQGSAEVGVVTGRTTTGHLVVEVQPRYEVAEPIAYDGDAGWRVGEVHAVRFRLVDGCADGNTAAPSPAAYRTARFVPSDGIEVAGPLSTEVGPDGAVHVDLRCTAADVDVALAMVDALDARRRTEILTTARLADQRPPFCLAPADAG